MYEEFLEGAGLTKNESAVYIALLKKGKSTAYQIVREAHVSSGKIYETLSKLSEKGMIKSVIENGVKHFSANDPESLFDLLKEKEKNLQEKEKELHKILPQLQGLKFLENKIEEVALIKGFRGISPIVYKVLDQGKNIKIMGLRSSKSVKFNNFWKNWHRKRIIEKKKAYLLFSDKGSEYWKFFKKQPYTVVRESLSVSPSAIMIVDDNVFIFSYEEEFTCIHIISSSIAKSFTGFFDSLWNFSK
jgi:sugar-specific transcriptional regulator TrmB